MNLKSFYILMIIFCLTAGAYSHGTKYEIVKSGKIGIKAMFDTGEAMSNADVLVFPPGAANFSVTEKSDEKGVFYITPDKPGTWTLQVRDNSGHGMRINLEIDESLSVKEDSETGSGLNAVQKVIMSLCVVWGAIGTALYFKGRRGQV